MIARNNNTSFFTGNQSPIVRTQTDFVSWQWHSCCSWQYATGRQQAIDSLYHELTIATDANQRVKRYNELGKAYKNSHPDSLPVMAERIAQQQATLPFQTYAYNSLMHFYHEENGNFNPALEHLRENMELAKNNDRKNWLSDTYINIGNTFLFLD